jgi:nicotinamidase-related amidase
MAVDLKTLLAPATTAVLVMECQEGIVGESAALGALAEAVRRHDTIGHIGRVLAAARGAGVPVFYLTVARRPACCWRSAARASRCCRARRASRSCRRWRRARATGC